MIVPASAHKPAASLPVQALDVADGERILHDVDREVSILLASEELTVTHARYAAGQQVARAHVHHGHTDAFYVLEGELAFEVGCEPKPITVSAGGFVAAPPGLPHSFRTDGDRPARWLTIHAHDGGFSAFMRGVRDGVDVDWDIGAVPASGGRPACDAIVSQGSDTDWLECGALLYRLRGGAPPDLSVVELAAGTSPDRVVTFLVPRRN